jgi:hypothetical protein
MTPTTQDAGLIERARVWLSGDSSGPDNQYAIMRALADRLEAREGWRAEMVGYQEWLQHLSQGFLMSEPLRRQAVADLTRVTAMLSSLPPAPEGT